MLDDPKRIQPDVTEASPPRSSPMSAIPPLPEPPAGSRVGAEMRATRQKHGWSLPDVANTLRIRLPYLEAIEDGRLNDMPGNAYAVGFVRTYATALGLDPTEIARRFRAETIDVNRKTELAFPAPVPERGVPAGAVILLGLLLAVGSYAMWYRFSGDTRSPAETVPAVPERLAPLAERAGPPSNLSPQVASILPPPSASSLSPGAAAAPIPMPIPVPTPVPVTVPPPALPVSPGETSRVMLRIKADSYIQVKEKGGPVLLNRVMRTGETWPVPRGKPLLMTTGNAGGTEVVVEGVASPALGGSGAVRRDIPLDADGLKPGAALPAPVARPAPAPL